MKYCTQGLLTLILCLGPATAQDSSTYRIWDDKPADNWELAYPVGNGRLGAMAFGGFPEGRILLNEETIWAQVDPQTMPKGSAEAVAEISRLILDRDYARADALFQKELLNGHRASSYQPLGNLWIRHFDGESFSGDLQRELLLDEGRTVTRIRLPDGSITRELLASVPDDIILLRIASTRPTGLQLEIQLDRPPLADEFPEAAAAYQGEGPDAVSVRSEGEDLVLEGEARSFLDGTLHRGGTRFQGRLRVRIEGNGELRTRPDRLEIRGAEAVTLLLAAATNYNRDAPMEPLPEGWQAATRLALDRVDDVAVETLINRARSDHRLFMERCRLDLGSTPASVRDQTTGWRRSRYASGQPDPDLVETYFQFGRYLLVASSRPGTLPANLQGIWNPMLEPPWKSDFHLNINLQMNYWPAETTNLSELHLPLIDFIEMLVPAGRKMAERLGCEGVCTGHATDAWAQARLMSTQVFWGGSFLSWQWLITHGMEHYRFTRDRGFLADRLWNLQKPAVEFCLSWLQRDPDIGLWIAGPSASPENRFSYSSDGESVEAAANMGNSFDQYLIRQVLTDFLEAAAILKREQAPLVERARSVLDELYMPGIDSKGRLMEWRKEYEEPEPGHRHISHVLGVYPGNQIQPLQDSKMKEVIERTLEYRLDHGGGHTGWSRAWITGLYARLGEGDRAHENLEQLLAKSTLDSLFDSHPPLQIDGNFGGTAAIAEMLIQSHENDERGDPLIRLLPALPAAWPSGSATGLRARGDVELDLRWESGRVTEVRLRSQQGSALTVALPEGEQRVELAAGEEKTIRP